MPFHWLPINRLMLAQLRKAQGVAIFPGQLKVAAGGRRAAWPRRPPDTTGGWLLGPPTFLTLSGASAGIQLRIERTDLVLTFRTRSDLELLKKGKLILGVDDILAIGSFGGEHAYGVGAGLKICILSDLSASKGFYAGWSVEGGLLQVDAAATDAYDQYQQNLLRNGGSTNRAGIPPLLRLQMKLAELSGAPPTPGVVGPSR